MCEHRRAGRDAGRTGGITRGDETGTAVALAAYGLPALTYLTTDDPEVRLMLIACLSRAIELDDMRQRNLAVHIANAVARSFRRG